jgi:phosphoglycolate phosphatase-like HAD superfamily hydrolase
MAPYPEMVAALRRAHGVELAIATAKDRASVEALLALYGIDDLFPAERLLDKESGVGKQAHLGVLRERLGIPFQRITFVDDKVNHLDAVAPLGVRCVLAGWGYNGPREEQLARSRGYPVAALDALAPVFGEPPPRP